MSHAAIDSTATMTLRPLDRQTVRVAPARVSKPAQPAETVKSTLEQDQEQVSRLAQTAFISRTYELKNPANVGQGLDGTVRYISAVASDIEGLSHPDLTVGTGIALTGKLVKDATGVVVMSGRVMDGLNHAHFSIARSVGNIQNASVAMSSTLHQVTETIQPVLTRVERVGAIGSLGMATIALPSLAVSAVKRNTELVQSLTDSKTSGRKRIEAIKEASYTNAALAYTAVAVPAAIKTLAGTGAGKSAITRMAQSAQNTRAYQASNRAAAVMTPVADATLLIADSLHLYTTVTSPSARGSVKARAALNVGLDALKLSLHAFPRTRGIQIAYTAAGVTQLGFAIHGLVRPAKP